MGTLMGMVHFRLIDGQVRDVEVSDGTSIMLAAIRNNVKGVEAECGGSLDCATCHVYVRTEDVERLMPPSETEADMLSAVAAERRPNSRLSCQLVMSPALDGIEVRVPDKQL